MLPNVLQRSEADHTPVLAEEVRELLDVRPGNTVVDATFGAGGHARLLAEDLGGKGKLVAIDRDPTAKSYFDRFKAGAGVDVRFLRGDFSLVLTQLAANNVQADAILLPKVESGDTVRQAEAIMAENGAAEGMAIWCMVETPRGILHAEEVASASRRIRCLVMGTSDLAKNLGATHTRERLPFLISLEMCLLAARACDVAIVDGVHLDLEDAEGFAHACRQGAELGFDGKTLIHPKTIPVANTAFSPSASELAWSRRIIESSKEARERGEGLVVVDGRLIENLHVEGARRALLLARAIAELEEESAR